VANICLIQKTLARSIWKRNLSHSILSNLPQREHAEFIGREKYIDQLLSLLSEEYAAHLISVNGIDGIGKTALVLETAYRCLHASQHKPQFSKVPVFEAFIFVSARQQYLATYNTLPRNETQRTLRNLFHEIAHTLGCLAITHTTPQDQPSLVYKALACQRTLLIVDNLETMEDKQEIISFLFSLPPSVKILVTTRERFLFSPIHLEQLSKKEATNLIKKECATKNITLSTNEALLLYRHIGGVPAALSYTIGRIAAGSSLEDVLGEAPTASRDIARICFERSVGPLRGEAAHTLLMVMAMFPKPPLREVIGHCAGLGDTPKLVDEALTLLQYLSLVTRQEKRYRLHPLTREYALAELAIHPTIEQEARLRWVEWYLAFTKAHGGNDWIEWHEKYDRVEEEWENLLTVFDWCAVHNQYEALSAFWQSGRVLGITDIYGYWDDRLTWLQWLAQKARDREDWPTMFKTIAHEAHTYIMMDELNKAEELLYSTRELPDSIDAGVRHLLAQESALLSVSKKKYEQASDKLNLAEKLLKDTSLDASEYKRRHILLQCYWGLLYQQQHDYDEAKNFFQCALERAQAIQWQRACICVENFLTDILREEGELDEAEGLLSKGLTVSESNKDKRRIAYYQRSFALLHRKRKNWEEASYYARKAMDGFDQLGMISESRRMSELLQRFEQRHMSSA